MDIFLPVKSAQYLQQDPIDCHQAPYVREQWHGRGMRMESPDFVVSSDTMPQFHIDDPPHIATEKNKTIEGVGDENLKVLRLIPRNIIL